MHYNFSLNLEALPNKSKNSPSYVENSNRDQR